MYLYLCVLLLTATTTKGFTYPIGINISPEVVHLNSAVTVTCNATGNDNGILTLIPYNVINGTYLPYSCVDSYESSDRFSGIQYYFTYYSGIVTFTTEVSINPITPLDDGLTLVCVFYDLQSQTYYSSRTLRINIVYPTAASTTAVQIATNYTTALETLTNLFTTPQSIPDNFVNSQDFYITVGTFSTVVFGAIALIFVLIAILIVCAFRRGQVATHLLAVDWNKNKYGTYPVRSSEV